MSLTILPQISSAGFTSQYHSVKPQPYKGKSITPQGNSNGKILNNQIESNTAKTISKDNFFAVYEKKKSDLDSLMKQWEKLSLS